MAVVQARVPLELPVECLVEQLEAQEEGSPRGLLVGVEPPDLAVIGTVGAFDAHSPARSSQASIMMSTSRRMNGWVIPKSRG